MDSLCRQFLIWGQGLPPELISLSMIPFCWLSIMGLKKGFGLAGLHVYNVLAVCLANIQILHLTTFRWVSLTLPLGTVVFTTTFFVNGLIARYASLQESRKSILLSSFAYIFFFLNMFLSLMHNPATVEDAYTSEALSRYQALLEIFTPTTRLFFASLCAFCISHLFYLLLLRWLGRASVQNSVCVFLSGILDHIVFTFCAFYLFCEVKPSWHVFIEGYLIGSLVVRFVTIVVFSWFQHLYEP